MQKNSIFLKTVCLTLSLAIFALTFCGCGSKQEKTNIEPMEAEEPDVYGFEFLGGTDVMPIAGYYGPLPSTFSVDGQSLPDYISDEFLKKISESGINLLHHEID